MKGSSCVDVSGMDAKFKRKQSFNGVSGMNSEFERLNLGIEEGCEPNNHPLLKRVGWRVLIIDDPDPNTKFDVFNHVHFLFFDFGCQVSASTKPSASLSLLKREKDRFDFVICNIHMKGMDEATLFELVGLKDVLVIMMSSYMDKRLVTEGMNHGASFFILKPQSFDDIETISSFVLKRKKYPSKLPRNLYQKFDEVVGQLGGLDEAVPEKILELMNAENIIPLEVIDERLKGAREIARLIQLRGTKKRRQDAEAPCLKVACPVRLASYGIATNAPGLKGPCSARLAAYGIATNASRLNVPDSARLASHRIATNAPWLNGPDSARLASHRTATNV